MPDRGERPVIISACLLGLKTRYDGEDSFNAVAVRDAGTFIIPVCPEQLGGLSTPREPAVIVGGDGADVLGANASVITAGGDDVTANFIRGAQAVLEIIRLTGADKAILKEKSPSCGVNFIYAENVREERSGERKKDTGNRVRSGRGVTAALLQEKGLQVLGY